MRRGLLPLRVHQSQPPISTHAARNSARTSAAAPAASPSSVTTPVLPQSSGFSRCVVSQRERDEQHDHDRQPVQRLVRRHRPERHVTEIHATPHAGRKHCAAAGNAIGEERREGNGQPAQRTHEGFENGRTGGAPVQRVETRQSKDPGEHEGPGRWMERDAVVEPASGDHVRRIGVIRGRVTDEKRGRERILLTPGDGKAQPHRRGGDRCDEAERPHRWKGADVPRLQNSNLNPSISVRGSSGAMMRLNCVPLSRLKFVTAFEFMTLKPSAMIVNW